MCIQNGSETQNSLISFVYYRLVEDVNVGLDSSFEQGKVEPFWLVELLLSFISYEFQLHTSIVTIATLLQSCRIVQFNQWVGAYWVKDL